MCDSSLLCFPETGVLMRHKTTSCKNSLFVLFILRWIKRRRVFYPINKVLLSSFRFFSPDHFVESVFLFFIQNNLYKFFLVKPIWLDFVDLIIKSEQKVSVWFFDLNKSEIFFGVLCSVTLFKYQLRFWYTHLVTNGNFWFVLSSSLSLIFFKYFFRPSTPTSAEAKTFAECSESLWLFTTSETILKYL